MNMDDGNEWLSHLALLLRQQLCLKKKMEWGQENVNWYVFVFWCVGINIIIMHQWYWYNTSTWYPVIITKQDRTLPVSLSAFRCSLASRVFLFLIYRSPSFFLGNCRQAAETTTTRTHAPGEGSWVIGKYKVWTTKWWYYYHHPILFVCT